MPTPSRPHQAATQCGACTAPTGDAATVCATCAEHLTAGLLEAADWAGELETTFARQSVAGRRVGDRSAETPLPYSQPAADAWHELRNLVTTWARMIVEERPDSPPADRVGDVCRWLADPRRVEWLRHHPAGPDAVEELTHVVEWRVVDNPPEPRDLGACEAPTEAGPCPYLLTALPDQLYVTCRQCGAMLDVQGRREDRLRGADDQLMCASWLASALTRGGQQVTRGTVASWVTRGRLVAHGRDGKGRATYRVGDALRLLADEAQAREARGGKRKQATTSA